MGTYDRYYDKLMRSYYKVLVNTWEARRKEALKLAVQMLADMPRDEKVNEASVRRVEAAIAQVMAEEFSYDIAGATRTATEQAYRIGLAESGQPVSATIRFSGLDARYNQVLSSQNLFWIRSHHQDGLGQKIMDMTREAVSGGATRSQLAEVMRGAFQESVGGSVNYYENLALHSMQRVREIAHVTGYEKAGAVAYEIVAVMDDRTSDICRALHGKVFPLERAIETRDAMLEVDTSAGPEAAKKYLQRVSPWVKDDQVVYNRQGEPIGIDGVHTPFPPFHWGCRTTTAMIYE